jgi:NHL repeat-containing protein
MSMNRSPWQNLIIVTAGVGVVAAIATVSNRDANAQAQSSTTARRFPVFEVDPSWPPKLPNGWILGQTPGVAVDSHDHIWVLHRPRTVPEAQRAQAAPPLLEFDADGKFLRSWGGPGPGFDWPDSEHGVFVDDKDNVWIGGSSPTSTSLTKRSDDMLLKFTKDGKFLLQIGGPDKSGGNADRKSVNKPADAFVHTKTNELYIADGYGNRRVLVLDADSGAFKRMWGAFGNKPMDDDHCEVVTPSSFPPGPGPQNFSIVHALRVARDGTVYVADRENRRVQQFTPDGKFVRQLVKTDTQFARNLALSHDPVQQFLYVGNGMDIAIVDRRSMEIVGTIKVPGMIGGGHQIAVDSKGNLYIAGTAAGLQKLTFKGMAVPK